MNYWSRCTTVTSGRWSGLLMQYWYRCTTVTSGRWSGRWPTGPRTPATPSLSASSPSKWRCVYSIFLTHPRLNSRDKNEWSIIALYIYFSHLAKQIKHMKSLIGSEGSPSILSFTFPFSLFITIKQFIFTSRPPSAFIFMVSVLMPFVTYITYFW